MVDFSRVTTHLRFMSEFLLRFTPAIVTWRGRECVKELSGGAEQFWRALITSFVQRLIDRLIFSLQKFHVSFSFKNYLRAGVHRSEEAAIHYDRICAGVGTLVVRVVLGQWGARPFRCEHPLPPHRLPEASPAGQWDRCPCRILLLLVRQKRPNLFQTCLFVCQIG